MKLGLYGGTFDPPHKAHLKLAEWVLNELHLDYIYFIPAAVHAFKNNSELSPKHIRLEMLSAAIKNKPKFRVSRLEIDRDGVSYTINSIQDFLNYEGIVKAKLYYIIGIDNLLEFHLWKDPEKILNLAQLIVIRRSGFNNHEIIKKYKDKANFLQSPIIDISATDIRYKIKNNIDVSDVLPTAVYKIIKKYGLYRQHN